MYPPVYFSGFYYTTKINAIIIIIITTFPCTSRVVNLNLNRVSPPAISITPAESNVNPDTIIHVNIKHVFKRNARFYSRRTLVISGGEKNIIYKLQCCGKKKLQLIGIFFLFLFSKNTRFQRKRYAIPALFLSKTV